MYKKYFIVNKDGEETLYLYVNTNDIEFASEFSYGSLDERYNRLTNSVENFIEDNSIVFNGNKVKIMLGSLLIANTTTSPIHFNKLVKTKSNPKKHYHYEKSSMYTVKPGDTLFSIAQNHSTSIWEIKILNQLDSNLIFDNQVLVIPIKSNANIYITKDKDDLSKVSKLFNIPPQEISKVNKLTSNFLPTGHALKIPSINLKTILHTVKSDESLEKIAYLYEVSVNDIISWNNLSHHKLIPNSKLIIHLESYNPNIIAGFDLSSNIHLSVLRVETGQIEYLSLEKYIFGVVASEMPANFEVNALKAQALASRTYIMHKLSENPDIIVNDTTEYQAYSDLGELKDIWQDNYEAYLQKISQVVHETKNEVITYAGNYINSLFFSTSNGNTLNSEEYFNSYFPYLRSVSSKWDKNSPFNKRIKRITLDNFSNALNLETNIISNFNISYYPTSNAVDKVSINNIDYTGSELRKKLYLNSSSFKIDITKDTIVITMNGFGHGVGLSQYGADGMGKDGYNYKDIIKHYYTNVSIGKIKKQ